MLGPSKETSSLADFFALKQNFEMMKGTLNVLQDVTKQVSMQLLNFKKALASKEPLASREIVSDHLVDMAIDSLKDRIASLKQIMSELEHKHESLSELLKAVEQRRNAISKNHSMVINMYSDSLAEVHGVITGTDKSFLKSNKLYEYILLMMHGIDVSPFRAPTGSSSPRCSLTVLLFSGRNAGPTFYMTVYSHPLYLLKVFRDMFIKMHFDVCEEPIFRYVPD